MCDVRARVAAEAAAFLTGRSAEDLGWPDRDCVTRQFAAAAPGGFGPAWWGDDPVGWCVRVLEPIISAQMPGPDQDLRELGWPHTPTVAVTLADWLFDAGISRSSLAGEGQK